MVYSALVLLLLLGCRVAGSSKELAVARDEVESPCNTSEPCPVWSVRTEDGCCECDQQRSIYNRDIHCDPQFGTIPRLEIKNCYCLYYDEIEGEALFTPCILTCYHKRGLFHYYLNRTSNYTEFNRQMCSGEALGIGVFLPVYKVCTLLSLLLFPLLPSSSLWATDDILLHCHHLQNQCHFGKFKQFYILQPGGDQSNIHETVCECNPGRSLLT